MDESLVAVGQSRDIIISMAEVIRQAIRRMQRAEEESFDQLLAATRGLWRKADALHYQRKLRREWKWGFSWIP